MANSLVSRQEHPARGILISRQSRRSRNSEVARFGHTDDLEVRKIRDVTLQRHRIVDRIPNLNSPLDCLPRRLRRSKSLSLRYAHFRPCWCAGHSEDPLLVLTADHTSGPQRERPPCQYRACCYRQVTCKDMGQASSQH